MKVQSPEILGVASRHIKRSERRPNAAKQAMPATACLNGTWLYGVSSFPARRFRESFRFMSGQNSFKMFAAISTPS
jgi:hypothetical protein